jgi:hypothetical protein
MNHYMNEQALLYMNELKNHSTLQTDNAPQQSVVQKSKVRVRRQRAWLPILVGMLNIIRGR